MLVVLQFFALFVDLNIKFMLAAMKKLHILKNHFRNHSSENLLLHSESVLLYDSKFKIVPKARYGIPYTRENRLKTERDSRNRNWDATFERSSKKEAKRNEVIFFFSRSKQKI